MTAPTVEAILVELAPLDQWARRCHAASLWLVRSGVCGADARVARGVCEGVGSQHSWVVLGGDCYAEDAVIVDPTLWSYRDDVEGVWISSNLGVLHTPHGKGQIWAWGKPASGGGEVVELTPSAPLSSEAEAFLELLGPLDYLGWGQLAHAPVEGWPAGEIIAAIYDTPALNALVPIDILGMITDRNPDGLYLAVPSDETATKGRT